MDLLYASLYAVTLPAPDPMAVKIIRWTGILAVAVGIIIIVIRWWRDR